MIRRPVSKIIVGEKADRDVFVNAVDVMEKEDSSYRIRFYVKLGDHYRHHRNDTDDNRSSNNLSSSLPNSSGMHFPLGFDEEDSDDGKDDGTDEDDNDDVDSLDSGGRSLPDEMDDSVVCLDGQGILIRDGTTGKPTHVSCAFV